uniref:Transposase n=1 Tax=Ditylenchus dipsaci TaxID=166011 RepID=A0A915ED71_9BILA
MDIDWDAISSDEEEENYADDSKEVLSSGWTPKELTLQGIIGVSCVITITSLTFGTRIRLQSLAEKSKFIIGQRFRKDDIYCCKRVVLRDGEYYEESQEEHNHPANPIDVEVYELTKKAIDIAKSNMLAANNYPRIPVDPARLVLSVVWRNLSDGSPFVIYDSGPAIEDWQGPHQRYIILSSAGCMEELAHARVIALDGTFKTSGEGFVQNFSFHGLIDGSFVPMVNVLMTRRRTDDYVVIMEKISSWMINNIAGFVVGLRNGCGFGGLIPRVKHRGCNFHFEQAILRRLFKSKQLKNKYCSCSRFNEYIRKMISLALIPQECIYESWKHLMNMDYREHKDAGGNKFNDDEAFPGITKFIRYMVKIWIGDYNEDGQIIRRPRFSDSMWMHSGLDIPGTVRTTCEIEAYHARLNAWFRKKELGTVSSLKIAQLRRPNRRRRSANDETSLKEILVGEIRSFDPTRVDISLLNITRAVWAVHTQRKKGKRDRQAERVAGENRRVVVGENENEQDPNESDIEG